MSPAPPRFICIHGHFYQPPRENPWLEAVEAQDSAAPYHDWNDRITAECYAPNAAARLLDEHGAIRGLQSNYRHISFNFGPTLLAWMAQARPDVYAQILLADQASARRWGRGNALAQVYGHCIMPLASRRDQVTQVRWGITDFVHRFGRRPDGMWLPETAVDRATLRVLAEHGLRFTILSPTQAARVRYGDGPWMDASTGSLDTTRPYRCLLGGGRDIVVFFYDAAISHAIAFAGLLNDGRELSRRLIAAASAPSGTPLAHIATDGESYGHHHHFGDMGLAAAIEAIERDPHVQLTNYASYLDRVSVHDTVELHDLSSWSCAHGVERWRADCGCNTGANPDWGQAWRAPLREALDWLKTQVDEVFERHGAKLFHDPWAARDAYITVLLHRDRERRDAFVDRHVTGAASARHRSRIWKLLEMQRNALLSFTSCGWFFDEPSGIETTQVLAYAARTLQLAADLGTHLQAEFLRRLLPMRSNLPHYTDGRHLYETLVQPRVADSRRVVAHYAMVSLFDMPRPDITGYAHRLSDPERIVERAGSASFSVGRAEITAEMTEQTETHLYAALHLSGHDLHCSVVPLPASRQPGGEAPASTPAAAAPPAEEPTTSAGPGDYARLQAELRTTFLTQPINELVRRMDALGGATYTLRDTFADERRRILQHVALQATAACLADFERVVATNRRLLDFLALNYVPIPDALRNAATLVCTHHIEAAVTRFAAGQDSAGGEAAAAEAVAAVTDARRWGLEPRIDHLAFPLADALANAVTILATDIDGGARRAHAVLDLAAALPVDLNRAEAQNRYYVFMTIDGHHGWSAAQARTVRTLGERLGFRLLKK